MKRIWVNFVLDICSALTALNLVFTGLLMYVVIPGGVGQGRSTLLGLDRHDWGDVHFWTAMVLLAIIVVHVSLHWQWICTMVCRAGKSNGGSPAPLKRNVAGVIFLALVAGLMAGILWWAAAATDYSSPGQGGRGPGGGWRQAE